MTSLSFTFFIPRLKLTISKSILVSLLDGPFLLLLLSLTVSCGLWDLSGWD